MSYSISLMIFVIFIAAVATQPTSSKKPVTDGDEWEAEQKLITSNSGSRSTPTAALLTPSFPKTLHDEKNLTALFVVNILAVKNKTAKDLNDVLYNDIVQEIRDEIAETVFLLVTNFEDENNPVDLDEVAKHLEERSFTVEKIVKDSKTQVIKVDLDSVNTIQGILNESNVPNNELQDESESEEFVENAREKRFLKKKGKGKKRGHGGGGYRPMTYTYTYQTRTCGCGCSYACCTYG